MAGTEDGLYEALDAGPVGPVDRFRTLEACGFKALFAEGDDTLDGLRLAHLILRPHDERIRMRANHQAKVFWRTSFVPHLFYVFAQFIRCKRDMAIPVDCVVGEPDAAQ